MDFGQFEGKNYEELKDNPDYQKWIDSNGTLPFPGGESREQFIRRSMEGFDRMMSDILKRSEKNTGIQNDTDTRYLKSNRGTEIPGRDRSAWRYDHGGVKQPYWRRIF